MTGQRGTVPSQTDWSSYKLVLSVDNDPYLLYRRYQLLSAAGFAMLSAVNGEEAMWLFNGQPIDIVVLDLVLPDTDGLLLAKNMRDSRPEVPIILTSDVDLFEEALSEVNAHLCGPVDENELLRTIREWLSKTDRQRRRKAFGT